MFINGMEVEIDDEEEGVSSATESGKDKVEVVKPAMTRRKEIRKEKEEEPRHFAS